MIKEFTRIYLTLNLLAVPLLGQDATRNDSVELKSSENGSVVNDIYTNGNGSVNRLPQLLQDVKVLLTEAMIADVHKDTLEVIYYLDRIYDLLGEADQLGEKTAEDLEEFERFIASLNDIYPALDNFGFNGCTHNSSICAADDCRYYRTRGSGNG
jgi:hypothetical protein